MSLFRPWFISTLLCLIYALAVVTIRGEGDPLILMTIGSDYSEQDSDHAYSEEGYDGQFAYYIARDPQTAEALIDVPAYRYQRILLPIGGIILSLGQDTLLPWALLLTNLLALAIGTTLLEYLLVHHFNVSRWYAVGYSLSLGVLGSARLITTETLAYALVLGGIVLLLRERLLLSAILFALSAFAKETTLIFVGAILLYQFSHQRWKEAFQFGIVSILPFIIWQFVLLNTFGAFGIGSGGNLATGFEVIPFMGFFRILTEGNIQIFLLLAPIIGLFVLLPAVLGLMRSVQQLKKRDFSMMVWILLANAGIMLFVPFSTYREPLGILRFIVGLQIAVILFAAQQRNRPVLLFSTFWLITVFLVILSDFGG